MLIFAAMSFSHHPLLCHVVCAWSAIGFSISYNEDPAAIHEQILA